MKRALITALMLSVAIVAAADSSSAFKVYLDESGVYQVTFEDLAEAGLEAGEIESDSIGMSNRGESVPIWVDDGGDGVFGPGDWIEFVGQRLSAHGLYFHEYSRHNVYWLTLDGGSVSRMRSVRTDATVMFEQPSLLSRSLHLEHDQLMIRIRQSEIESGDDADLWFWAKMSQIDPDPVSLKFPLPGLAVNSGRNVDLRIGVRGISLPTARMAKGIAHHRIEVTLNGEPLGHDEWDGRKSHVIEMEDVSIGRFKPGQNVLAMSIPQRMSANESDQIVDVVMLNWIEADYPHSGVFGKDSQAPLYRSVADGVADGESRAPVEIRSNGRIRLYLEAGTRVEPFVVSGGFPGAQQVDTVRLDPGTADGFVVSTGELRGVGLVQLDNPSEWTDTSNRADYLMIAHQKLIDAIQPLAEFHRENGLVVEVIDVEDVYDEFNNGIMDPTAIRDFISHAYHQWQPPAPRFVLLVGDASWDTKNTKVDDHNYANWVDRQIEEGTRFVARKAPVYAEKSALNHRQLIPTWNYTSHQGHSASDNYFVAVDGDGFSPDLAIGRFPLVEPEEVEAVVAKTIGYSEQPRSAPWHRNALWITNESEMFQRSSDELALYLAERGFAAAKVYPSPEEADNELHQGVLQEQLNSGQLIVHFLGHGGRHIWRTGPPDFKKNHDLFTLDHVAALEPTQRLSFVLSMTCYSGPFDHPNQDSIGEMFLRVPDRGAVGVFAASWRNSPSRGFSQEILSELTDPGTTVGEAIMRAKQVTKSRTLVETYNLLGDPAISLVVPAEQLVLEVEFGDGATVVTGIVDQEGFNGDGLLEWVDAELKVLRAESVVVVDSALEFVLEGEGADLPDGAFGVRIWAADQDQGREAVGWRLLEFEVTDAEPDESVSASVESVDTDSVPAGEEGQ